MAPIIRKNGTLELKYNEDRTQALATIYPPRGDGESVTANEVMERLKNMGVTYGIRDMAILDAIHYALNTGMPAANVVVAQGAIPQDGQDARITYQMPQEILSRPLPKRADGSGVPDWFALDAEKMVKAGDKLASIIPSQPGVPGKTITWPIQNIAPKPGKPALLSAGQNVRASEDGLKLYAMQDGYVCLQGEQLVIHALRVVREDTSGGEHAFPAGAVFLGNAIQAAIRAEGFVAIQKKALACQIRAQGDIIVGYAENCSLVASGNVYVTHALKNCTVNTRNKVIALGQAQIIGGSICASSGVNAVTLGDGNFTPTEIEVSTDRITELRDAEIEKELAVCDAMIARIVQALKPFATLTVQDKITDEQRALLIKLQAQKRSQEDRIKTLHNERRTMLLLLKEKVTGSVQATAAVHPGVYIRSRAAALLVEAPLQGARFTEGAGGKSIQVENLQKAA